MYRLVIADDEFAIRNGLAKMIPWNDIGFEVMGRFEDGKDVISYVEKHDVDALLLDVEMFDVSGLKVAKWIAEKRPSVVVVMLSGYKEFEYVREALQAKVFDYLLKPIDPEEVVKVFRQVKITIDEQGRGIHELPHLHVKQTKEQLSVENAVKRAQKYIKEHIAEELSVEIIAEKVYFSKSYFAREFKRIAGESVMDYVLRKRMELAVSLIKEGETSQKKIAAAVGYSDLKYFQRTFNKYTGYTVKEYQRLLHH